MKIARECIPCLTRQAVEIAAEVTSDSDYSKRRSEGNAPLSITLAS